MYRNEGRGGGYREKSWGRGAGVGRDGGNEKRGWRVGRRVERREIDQKRCRDESEMKGDAEMREREKDTHGARKREFNREREGGREISDRQTGKQTDRASV